MTGVADTFLYYSVHCFTLFLGMTGVADTFLYYSVHCFILLLEMAVLTLFAFEMYV
jgi:hypothetical protein